MNKTEKPMHYVCTPEKAAELIATHKKFWVCNCGCRENKGKCKRSRMDVCLAFTESAATSGSGRKEVGRAEAEALLRLADSNQLVARPFRDDKTRKTTEGICFCCDDCCSYFLNGKETCDPGAEIEVTDRKTCNDCGLCEEACHFGARQMAKGKLWVDRDRCYGCALCVSVCPEESIRMGARDLRR